MKVKSLSLLFAILVLQSPASAQGKQLSERTKERLRLYKEQQTLVARGELREALRHLEGVLAPLIPAGQLHLQTAQICYELGQFERAEREFMLYHQKELGRRDERGLAGLEFMRIIFAHRGRKTAIDWKAYSDSYGRELPAQFLECTATYAGIEFHFRMATNTLEQWEKVVGVCESMELCAASIAKQRELQRKIIRGEASVPGW